MYSAIAANKRNTAIIMVVFVLIIGGIGALVGLFTRNMSITIPIIIGGLIYAIIQYFIADKLMMFSTGAQEITKADNPRLWRIVENLAITEGMPMPRVCIINDPAPNAFATGRDPQHALVGATTGILEIMDNRELEAVFAHELGHVKNYDIRVSLIAFGLASALGIIADIGGRMLIYGSNDDNDSSGIFGVVIGIAVMILLPITATMIQMAISRQREYLADATGVKTTRDPEGLARALEKLMEYGQPLQRQSTTAAHVFFSNPLSGGTIGNLFSTHPPLEERIKRLRTTLTEL